MSDQESQRGDGRRIDAAIADASPGLWPFIPAGYPSVNSTALLLREMGKLPIRGIEVGIPFSDPIADGPVIQQAFSHALSQGVRVNQVLDAIATARRDVRQPILVMVSASIVYRKGMESFIERAASAGVDGLIVPDLSLEEAPALTDALRVAGLKLAMLVAPTTSDDRRRRIAESASGFLYYVSIQGTTGVRHLLPANLESHVRELRASTGMPVLVGFGISRPEQVRQVCGFADGAIVGSAIVKKMLDTYKETTDDESVVRAVRNIVSELAVP